MLIIVDEKISQEAKKKLSHYGEILEIRTENITYPAISGHPDIFFCQAPGRLFVAPNLPPRYFDQLKEHQVDFITGELPVGPEYPASARYNAVATENYLIHNFRHTDFTLTRTLEDHQLIHVDQGYCRCNLLPLKEDHFITSDMGIYKVMSSKFKVQSFDNKELPNSTFNPATAGQPSTFPKVLHVSPESILLPGFAHGFFGGCCGICEDKVFINGSLSFHPDSGKIKEYLTFLGYEIVELGDGPMMDVGSIFFL